MMRGQTENRCWVATGTACDNEENGLFADQIGKCNHCDIYIKVMRSLLVLYLEHVIRPGGEEGWFADRLSFGNFINGG
jgi:hypothetical protein